MEMDRLPLGTSDFVASRLAGQIYVDKTDLVRDVASETCPLFLFRPRRFGKSTLISTLETLFGDGLKHFAGLKIDGNWDDGTYGVVRLDLSGIKDAGTIEEMRAAFDGVLRTAFGKAGFVYVPDDGRSCLGQVDAWLDRQEINSLVLLVDELDAPLDSHMDDPALFDGIMSMLSGFFAMVKSSNGVWRFVLATGVVKLGKASIFSSSFNNMLDISLNPRYGTLLGYTEDEILSSFGPFVENAARANGMGVPALMDAMRARYGGFCFDAMAKTGVYDPWSVLSFLRDPGRGLRNLCEGSGRAARVRGYLEGRSAETSEFLAGRRLILREELQELNDLKTLSPAVALCQSGCLTIKERSWETLRLGYPNKDAEESAAMTYAGPSGA